MTKNEKELLNDVFNELKEDKHIVNLRMDEGVVTFTITGSGDDTPCHCQIYKGELGLFKNGEFNFGCTKLKYFIKWINNEKRENQTDQDQAM